MLNKIENSDIWWKKCSYLEKGLIWALSSFISIDLLCLLYQIFFLDTFASIFHSRYFMRLYENNEKKSCFSKSLCNWNKIYILLCQRSMVSFVIEATVVYWVNGFWGCLKKGSQSEIEDSLQRFHTILEIHVNLIPGVGRTRSLMERT